VAVFAVRGGYKGLSTDIGAFGSSETTIHSDARDEHQVSELIERVESELGPMMPGLFQNPGDS